MQTASTGENPALSRANHLDYCAQRSIPEGSSLYYATLFVPPARKTQWLGLLTVVREIQAIPQKIEDSQLAAIKLAWWKTELDKTIAGQASHPATLCLGQQAASDIGLDPVARLVEAVSVANQWPRHFTGSDWDSHCADWGGQAFRMSARVLGCPPGPHDDHIEAWGAQAMRLAQLLMLAPAISQGWHPFPVDLLQRHGVSAESLRRREDSQALSSLLAQLQQETVSAGNHSWAALPRSVRLSLRPLRALWRMRVAEMKLAGQAGYPLLRERIRITPLKKLWLAWSSHALRL